MQTIWHHIRMCYIDASSILQFDATVWRGKCRSCNMGSIFCAINATFAFCARRLQALFGRSIRNVRFGRRRAQVRSAQATCTGTQAIRSDTVRAWVSAHFAQSYVPTEFNVDELTKATVHSLPSVQHSTSVQSMDWHLVVEASAMGTWPDCVHLYVLHKGAI